VPLRVILGITIQMNKTKNFIILILILLVSCLFGYLNASRVHQPFFGVPPTNTEEKRQAARKELNKNIPLIDFNAALKNFEDNSKIFVDARHKEEFEKGHIEEAISLPQQTVEKALPEFLQKYGLDFPLVVYCGGLDCSSAVQLANFLYDRGYRNLEVYAGGWQEWQKLHKEKK
jgi:rhodanese-related sulfurtransferase